MNNLHQARMEAGKAFLAGAKLEWKTPTNYAEDNYWTCAGLVAGNCTAQRSQAARNLTNWAAGLRLDCRV